MASTTALWIPIETAFSEIESLCIEARAAELALQQKLEEASLVRAMATGRVSREAPAVVESDPRQARASELSRDLAFREAHAAGANYVEMRAKIRKRLQWLKGKLAEVLTEHEVHHVLFPLVVYSDELVTSIARGKASKWEPLQSELYEIDNGGELFFTIIDDHLRKSETHPIIFEVSYFCLSDGFVGMYESDARKIEEYKTRLAERIPLQPVDSVAEAPAGAIELVPFPWRYYAVAAAAIVVGWGLFAWIASAS